MPNSRFASSPQSSQWLTKSGILYIWGVVCRLLFFCTPWLGMFKSADLALGMGKNTEIRFVPGIWYTSKTYMGPIQDIFMTYLEHIQDISRTYPGYIQDISGTYLEHIWDISGTYLAGLLLMRLPNLVIIKTYMQYWLQSRLFSFSLVCSW